MAPKPKNKPVPRETSATSLLKSVGREFLAERLEREKSLQDIQAGSGVSYSIISQIERGMATNVTLSKLQAIAKALGGDLAVSFIKGSSRK